MLMNNISEMFIEKLKRIFGGERVEEVKKREAKQQRKEETVFEEEEWLSYYVS